MKGHVFINKGSVQMSVNIIQSSGCFSGVVLVVVHSADQSAQSPACGCVSLLPQEVQHGGLQIVSEGTHSRHQPVRTEAGISVDHTLCHVNPASSPF